VTVSRPTLRIFILASAGISSSSLLLSALNTVASLEVAPSCNLSPGLAVFARLGLSSANVDLAIETVPVATADGGLAAAVAVAGGGGGGSSRGGGASELPISGGGGSFLNELDVPPIDPGGGRTPGGGGGKVG